MVTSTLRCRVPGPKREVSGDRRFLTRRRVAPLSHMDSGKLHWVKPEIPVKNVSPKSLLDLSKVIRLLEDPLTERHLFVLKKLLKRNQSGFVSLFLDPSLVLM
ncbi:hypothetical protein CRENBAI_015056 [Crenichthys baileyi]|uniref:Uncharacterized protein n=1 Tax=Crenichthys baileyi TaxID=28760 RepID=A0AAV9QXK7_9TELE